MTTIENSVGVRIPAQLSTAGRTAEDTPHDGVVEYNRPVERTDEVTPAGMAGAALNVVTHHDATSGRRRRHGPESSKAGDRREGRADDGQHMA